MDDLTKLTSQRWRGGAGGTDPMAALAGLQQAVQQEGGLDGLLGKLRDGGLGDAGRLVGRRRAPTSRSIRPRSAQALGPDTVQRLSAGSGIDIGALLPLLAMFLPQIIDMLTPTGRCPDGGLEQAASGMPTSAACSAGSWAVPAGPAAPAAARISAGCSAASWAATSAERPGRASPPGHRRTSMPRHDRGRWSRPRRRPACSGHGRTRPRRHPHPAVPRARSRSSGCPRSDPTATPAPRPDLVLVGRRRRCSSSPSPDAREGPQPARAIRRDARRGRCRRRLRRRPAPGPRRDPRRARPPRSCPPATSRSTPRSIAGIGLTPAEYAETYSLAVRITPSHYLGWHGRSIPQSVRVAGAPRTTIEEPAIGRPSLRDWLGEPLARGLRGFGVGLLRPGAAGAL